MAQVFCVKCYDTVIEYAALECGHTFCFKCVDKNQTIMACTKCSTNRLRYEHKYQIQIPQKCVVCESKSNKEYPFSCGHAFCSGCLQSFWVVQMKEGHFRTLHDFRCPHCRGSYPMSQERLHNLLPPKIFVLIKDRVEHYLMTRCPCCDQIFTSKSNHQIICTNCNTELCKRCREVLQQNHNCFKIDIKSIINVMKEDVRYCPHCDDPYLKDEHCDHVKCLQCQKQFCYFCMAPYDPIRNHGQSRHRQGCRNWRNEDNIIVDCNKCDGDCNPAKEHLRQYVQRKKYFMMPNYLDFYSAPGYQQDQGLFQDFGFFE